LSHINRLAVTVTVAIFACMNAGVARAGGFGGGIFGAPVPDQRSLPMGDIRGVTAPRTNSPAQADIDKLATPESRATPEPRREVDPRLPRFELLEFDVLGNTVLDDGLIQEALAPFMGPGKTAADVDNARMALETLYKDKGYKTVSVTLPKQKVKDGLIVLQVAEEKIGHLTVVGSKYHSIDKIKKAMPTVAEGSVPDWEKMRTELVAIDQQQDLTVTPALKAGTAPGTVDMDLVVDDKLPLHGMLELNNRYSQDTVHNRLIGNISYGNLWQRGDSLSLTYQTAPQDTKTARILFGNYLAVFGDSPFSLLFSGLRTTSNVTTLGGITVLGAGKSYGAQGIWKLPEDKDSSSEFSAGITYKNFNTSVGVGGGVDPIQTPAVYYPIALGYSRFGHGDGSNTQFDATFTFANGRKGSDTASLDLGHYGARRNMMYLRSNYSWTQDLPAHLQSYVHVTGQLTDQPLISNEQLSGGGMDTVRGYLEAEAIGDEGVESSWELRAPSLPDLISSPGFAQHVQDLRFFAFVDQAWLRMHGPFPPDESATATRLLSTGVGLNLNVLEAVHGVLDFGHPLVTGPHTEAGRNRVSFRFWLTY
jgi:hemolysin activation/secretion protein